MTLTVLRFLALLFVALTLAPSLAHVLELPNKIGLSGTDYLTVQRIYQGWALLGIVVIGALLLTLALAFFERSDPRGFGLTVFAFLCILAAQIVFWMYTYPVNVQTQNWTVLPENWIALRKQWEYSHASGAALNLLAFIALLVHVVLERR